MLYLNQQNSRDSQWVTDSLRTSSRCCTWTNRTAETVNESLTHCAYQVDIVLAPWELQSQYIRNGMTEDIKDMLYQHQWNSRASISDIDSLRISSICSTCTNSAAESVDESLTHWTHQVHVLLSLTEQESQWVTDRLRASGRCCTVTYITVESANGTLTHRGYQVYVILAPTEQQSQYMRYWVTEDIK